MNEKPTRRTAIKIGAATVLAPAFATVTRAATSSGEVEITTTSTIPTNTSISIKVYEDKDDDGTEELVQEKTIAGGTDVRTAYGALDGAEGQGYTYWMDINLSTSDDSVTPELDSMTITLPDEKTETDEPTAVGSDPQGFDSLLDNYLFFVSAVVTAIAGIGATSKSVAIGAIAAYSAFALIAIQTGTQLFENILIVTLVLVFIGFAFKFWRLEGLGGGNA